MWETQIMRVAEVEADLAQQLECAGDGAEW
jgi:hypothetical protein